jgi:hypothetical protein
MAFRVLKRAPGMRTALSEPTRPTLGSMLAGTRLPRLPDGAATSPTPDKREARSPSESS